MINIIKAIPLLSHLQRTDLKKQIDENQLYLTDYTKGATVYNQKDRCMTLDIIVSGKLVAYSLLENGSIMTMFEFTRGEILGANLLFGDKHAYPFTIYCMEDAQILCVTGVGVLSFLHSYEFALQYVGMLSRNSQKLNRRIKIATQNTLRENLLEYLKQQSILQQTNTILLPISKKQLADYLGVQRPSLFRELKALKEEDIITVFNRTIQLNFLKK